MYLLSPSIFSHNAAADPHSGYLLASGTRTGATSQAQTFTNGVVLGNGSLSLPTLSFAGDADSGISFAESKLSLAFAGSTDDRTQLQLSSNRIDMIRTRSVTSPVPNAALFLIFRSTAGATVGSGPAFVFDAWDETNTDRSLGRVAGYIDSLAGVSTRGGIIFTVRDLSPTGNDEVVRISPDRRMGIKVTAPSAILHLGASSTTNAALRFDAGSEPTTPNDGDVFKLSDAFVMFGENATTNAVVSSLRLRRSSSGTPAAGFGGSLELNLKSSTTANQSAGVVEWLWNDATHANRTADLVLSAYYTSTKREAIRIRGGSSATQLGFFGTTPAAKQTVSGSRGGNAGLASLLTALATLGLITDSSSA